MNVIKHYIKSFMNESKSLEYEYLYSDIPYAYDSYGWLGASSPKELKSLWELEYEEDYGDFKFEQILVLKPAVSVEKAMVLVEWHLGNYVIYPSIDASINGPDGLLTNGYDFDHPENLSDITEEEVKELLQTKDLNRAKELLAKFFSLKGLYEYVSGPMPQEDGWTPGSIIIPNNFSNNL